MRASERLFEANFCSEVARVEAPNRVFWFAPTQNAEADLAFDLMTAHGGQVAAFQMKTATKELSPRVDAAGAHRRLRLEFPHKQLMQLRTNFAHLPGTAFYAFPSAFSVADYLQPGFDLLARTFRFDIVDVPPAFPAPTAHGKATARRDEKHLGDFDPDALSLTLHSEPLSVPIRSVASTLVSRAAQSDSTRRVLSDRGEFRERFLAVPGLLVAVIAPPPAAAQ